MIITLIRTDYYRASYESNDLHGEFRRGVSSVIDQMYDTTC